MGALIHGCKVDVGMPFGFTQHDRTFLLGEEVVEGFYGGEFVVFDVEDGVELGHIEHVLDFLGEAEELEFAPSVADGREAADQFADAGGVDVIDMGEVEDDFFLALSDELADSVAKLSGFVAKRDASADVDDSDVADFAGGDGHVFQFLVSRPGMGGSGEW
jgi:hypothetical protein